MQLLQPFRNTGQVMLEPVSHQKRFAVGGFDDILQSVKLGRGCGCVAQRQHQLLFQVRVFFLFILGKPNRVFTADQLWHMQVVGGLHRDGDFRNLTVDGVLRIGQGFVGVDDLAVSLVRREVIGAVLGDEPSKPLPHVQDAKLRPQIHQTIGSGSAGQSDDAAHLGSDL